MVLWFALGIGLLFLVLDSALRTFVLPRAATPLVTRVVFIGLRSVLQPGRPGGSHATTAATR